MAQYIKQGNIFGRIGTGFGKGLAEQIPKEIEHQRLSSGLKKLGEEGSDLSPTQFLTNAYSTYGITPQMVQSLGEAAKYQRHANAYGNQQQRQTTLRDVQGKNVLQQAVQNGLPVQDNFQYVQPVQNQENGQNKITSRPKQQQLGGPQISPANPLLEQNLPPRPWSPVQRDAVVKDYINQSFTPEQAEVKAADDEARYMQDADAYRKGVKELEDIRGNTRDEFTEQLEEKLQKKGDLVLNDLSGNYIAHLKKEMEKELRLNPNASTQDVADKFSAIGLRTARAKNKVDELINTTGIENFGKGDSEINKLKEYGKIFEETGASDDFYNLLKKEARMSPQAAASFAYAPSKKIQEYISNFKGEPLSKVVIGRFGVKLNPVSPQQSSRQAAVQVGPLIGPNDSLLTIARELSLKYPDFDQAEFFEQMSDDRDNLQLNDRQRDEIAQGAKDIVPSWGDILFTKFKSAVRKK